MNIFGGMKILWISFGVITKHQKVNPKNGPGLRMYGNIRVPPPPFLTQVPHRRHCVVVLEQDTFILALYWFNPGRPSRITERLLSGRKESNQSNKQTNKISPMCEYAWNL